MEKTSWHMLTTRERLTINRFFIPHVFYCAMRLTVTSKNNMHYVRDTVIRNVHRGIEANCECVTKVRIAFLGRTV